MLNFLLTRKFFHITATVRFRELTLIYCYYLISSLNSSWTNISSNVLYNKEDRSYEEWLIIYTLVSLSELMQMAQLKMVANLKFYYRRKKCVLRRMYPYPIWIGAILSTLCCHVQTSSLNRFKFNSRKTFSNVSIYIFFY